eukprot:m.952270 g.952270  ORF g.952270 m.952270 type:complete len:916 (-) comp23868_c2_seq9:2794-5541(-)
MEVADQLNPDVMAQTPPLQVGGSAAVVPWSHFQEAFESFEREFVGQIPIDFGIRVVRAVKDIHGRNADELTVRCKDLLRVLSKREKANDGWWCGLLRGNVGLFPSASVEAYPMALVPRLALAVSGGADTGAERPPSDVGFVEYLAFEQGDLIEILHEPLVGDVYLGCVREVQGPIDAACLDWPKSNFDDGMHGPEDSGAVLCECVGVFEDLRLAPDNGSSTLWTRTSTTNATIDVDVGPHEQVVSPADSNTTLHAGAVIPSDYHDNTSAQHPIPVADTSNLSHDSIDSAGSTREDTVHTHAPATLPPPVPVVDPTSSEGATTTPVGEGGDATATASYRAAFRAGENHHVGGEGPTGETTQPTGETTRLAVALPVGGGLTPGRGGQGSVEIDFQQLVLRECVGRGGFATVYKATLGEETVAVKKLILASAEHEPEVLVKMVAEARLNASLQHRNIVQFRGVCTVAPNFAIVMEFVDDGMLHTHLRKSTLEPTLLVDWATQIANGMSYLHNDAPTTIIHRDLKSLNVLVTSTNVLKITDFGMAREHTRTTRMSGAGTAAWMAPEVIRSGTYTKGADIWSYGVVIWEMITGQIPYQGVEQMAVAYGVGRGKLTLPIPSDCPQPFGELMRRCWAPKPHDRPPFASMLAQFRTPHVVHEFMRVPRASMEIKQVEWHKEIPADLKRRLAEAEKHKAKLDERARALALRAQQLKELEQEQLSREKDLREREFQIKQSEVQLHLRETYLVQQPSNLFQVQPPDDMSRAARSGSNSSKSKKSASRSQRRISKGDIGAPSDFRHIGHVRHPSNPLMTSPLDGTGTSSNESLSHVGMLAVSPLPLAQGDGPDLSGFGGVSPRGGSRSKREVGVETVAVHKRNLDDEFADADASAADGSAGGGNGDDAFDADTPMLDMPPPPPPEYA